MALFTVRAKSETSSKWIVLEEVHTLAEAMTLKEQESKNYLIVTIDEGVGRRGAYKNIKMHLTHSLYRQLRKK